MPFLVALCFSIVQTFLNNIPEGNLLESVYNTLKIAFTFMLLWTAKAVFSRVVAPILPIHDPAMLITVNFFVEIYCTWLGEQN